MDEKTLMETGRRKGLTNREHVEKDYFQDLFLYNLFKKTNNLVFKGGTALYKIYKMPRFSEDLDFTLLGKLETEKLIKEVAGLMNGQVKTRKTEDSLLFKIGFTGILSGYNTLRIDVSTKNRVLGGFDVVSYVPEYIDINPFSLRILKPKEMIAEKIHSLFARKKARDLYDLFFLLRISEFDRELAEKKFAIFDMRFSRSKFIRAVNEVESLWRPELKPFVLAELPDYKTVKKFVVGKVR